MILTIAKYGSPILRQKGRRIDAITHEIERLIQDMFETMYAARGIGLAAQQVNYALQLTVLDLRGVTDRPSTLELSGRAADVEDLMPLVLINPELQPFGEPISGAEGCLSFPEIYAEITRLESVEVTALNEKGKRLGFTCGGLLARAVQHEWDHLQGILFIDRMSKEVKQELKPQLDELKASTKAELEETA